MLQQRVCRRLLLIGAVHNNHKTGEPRVNIVPYTFTAEYFSSSFICFANLHCPTFLSRVRTLYTDIDFLQTKKIAKFVKTFRELIGNFYFCRMFVRLLFVRQLDPNPHFWPWGDLDLESIWPCHVLHPNTWNFQLWRLLWLRSIIHSPPMSILKVHRMNRS